jgi:hypothetical protein
MKPGTIVCLLLLAVVTRVEAGDCIKDQSGNVVCGAGQCAMDQYGKVCARSRAAARSATGSASSGAVPARAPWTVSER